MSDPKTKAERSKAKDIRQGIIEQKPIKAKSKKNKPFSIFVVLNMPWLHGYDLDAKKPFRYGRYSTREAADQALKKLPSFYQNPTILEE